MTEEQKAALMTYCRIDELTPEEEPIFEGMYQAAVGYMEAAGIAGPEEGTPRRGQYDLCVSALVLDSWDRRGASSSGTGTYTVVENRYFRQTLKQLQLTEPESGADTSESGERLCMSTLES